MNNLLHDGALQVFDVDHGQCALLTMPTSWGTTYRVLIDCGHAVNFRGGPWHPGEHLQSMGVTYVDMLVCTNFDEDHMSGFPDMEERGITIGCLLGNPSVAPETIIKLKTEDGRDNLGRGIEAVARSMALRRDIGWRQIPPQIPGVHMIWTWNRYPTFEDENNLSLVFTLDVLGHRFMFPGDMECAGWRQLLELEQFWPVVYGVDVLVAAHHGRRNGICPEMFSVHRCQPKVIVISDDYKQYETQETTDFYGSKASGISGFRTDLGLRKVLTTRCEGPITFSFQGRHCFVY